MCAALTPRGSVEDSRRLAMPGKDRPQRKDICSSCKQCFAYKGLVMLNEPTNVLNHCTVIYDCAKDSGEEFFTWIHRVL